MTVPLDVIFRTERPRLLRYFNAEAGRDVAPDMVQEVFTRLLGSTQCGTIDNPSAYMMGIARNLLIDRARRMKRDRSIFLPLDEERDAPTKAEQDWGIELADLSRLYRQAVDAMSPKTRHIFLMHRQQHLTYRQIAAQLGVTEATVEYHMMRGLARCRRAIARGR